MTSTIKYPITRVVKWYIGNFCTRKCFNKDERMSDCFYKFHRITSENKSLMITHKEFKDMMDNDDILICKLKPGFRRKTVSWRQFERWQRNPEFDPDAME